MTLHVTISRSNTPVIDCSVIDLARLHAMLAERDDEIASLTVQLDDLLDRESMHALDDGSERLTTSALLERFGTARANHQISATTRVAGERARRARTAVGPNVEPVMPAATSQHCFIDTRPDDVSRVRGQGSARTAAKTSAAAVRATRRIPMHDPRALILRALHLAALDLGWWARRWLLLIAAPVAAVVTAKCSATPTHTAGAR